MGHVDDAAEYERQRLELCGVECEYCKIQFIPRVKRGPKPKHLYCSQACRVRLSENERLGPRRYPHVSIKVPFAERKRIYEETRKGWKK